MVKITQGETTPWGIWDGTGKGCRLGRLRRKDLCVVYVLDCGKAGYYVGHTCNLLRRLTQHYTKQGSWFTRKHGVRGVMWISHVYPRREAAKLEHFLKYLARPAGPSEIPYEPLAPVHGSN